MTQTFLTSVGEVTAIRVVNFIIALAIAPSVMSLFGYGGAHHLERSWAITAVMMAMELVNSLVVHDLLESSILVRSPELSSAVPLSPLIHTCAALLSMGWFTMYQPCLYSKKIRPPSSSTSTRRKYKPTEAALHELLSLLASVVPAVELVPTSQ